MNTVASLFNLGGPDLIVILGIVLLLFGAKKLPELAKGMGQAVKEFNKAKDEFEREVSKPVENSLKIEQPKETLAHGGQTSESASSDSKPQTPAV